MVTFDFNGMRKKFENDILNLLCEWKTEESRRGFKRGASLSHVLDRLRDLGWSNLGNIHKLEDLLYALGFRVVPALLKSGKEHKYFRCVTL